MSSSSENISETSATKNTSENESVSCEKENKVTNETIVAREQELKGFIETLKCLLHEFQTECTGDQELLQLVEDQEKVFQNIATVESRAAVVLQGARGSKDEVFSQGLQVLGQGEWQKFFEEGKLGTTQSYGYEELKSIATSKDLDDELSALSNKFLPIWESNISLLPCTYAKMLLNLRKKRKLFQKRMITCISIIGRLSKPSQTNQAASVKLDELKIKLKKLQLDWSRHQKNELENLEQYRKRKMKEKEKEEQRMKKELEKQEKNAEKEKQKMERWYRLQERDEKKRATQEQKERKRMDTEAEQQAIHRQAAVLEKFIRSVPKLPLFQGINRRLVSASDDLQQMTRGNSGQEDNENVRDLLLSIRRTRKQAWNKLGIKYVSFGQGQSNRVKLLQFEGSCRPPFHGVVQKPLKLPNGRNPYIRLSWLDYDYDSEMEWVESEPGENISESASDDDDSLMDTECSSSSDDDSFLIDDENMSQNHYGSGPEGCFPIEELVGIVFSHESNDAERDVLSKFPRKQISHVKIVNCKGTSSKTYLDYLNNTEIILDDRPDQVPEMKDNWKTLEEFWQVQEKNTDNLSKIPSSPSGT